MFTGFGGVGGRGGRRGTGGEVGLAEFACGDMGPGRVESYRHFGKV